MRTAGEADIAACNLLCRRVHGFDRGAELREAVGAHTALVVEHLGRITGYATGLGFFAHAVAETNQDLKSLIAAAPEIQGPGFLLPTRNHEVLAWCLDGTQARHANDIDEYRALQQTGGRVAAVNPILTTQKNNVL